MDADNGQAGFLIFLMPIPQLRNDVSAVNSTIRPEFHQHNAALQSIHCKRFAIDPGFSGNDRRRRTDDESVNGRCDQWRIYQDQEQRESQTDFAQLPQLHLRIVIVLCYYLVTPLFGSCL